MTKQQIANPMLKDFPWDGSELVAPLTLPGALLAPSYVEQKQIATPANPPAGSLRLYPKSDGKYYQLDSAGNEMIISGMSQAQTDARYLPLTGGTLTGPLTLTNLTAQNIVASGSVTADGIVANTYKWTPASDGESLYKEMPGRLRLSGAQLTVDQNVNVGTYTQLAEIATPVTPNTGQVRLYAKADHKVYIRDTTGTETDLTFQGMTQATADTLYPRKTDTDPYPQYLTAVEGDARYAANPGGPSGGYLTIASAAATYLPLVGGTLTGNLLFSADNTRDIGSSALRPRNVYAGTQFLAAVGTSAAPGYSFGGGNTGTGMYLPAAGILTLVAAQNVVASISNGLVSLDGNVVFTYDNTRDIGASGANGRPRDMYLARNLISSPTGSINFVPTAVGSYGAGIWVSMNAYFDGTNFQAYNVANPTTYFNLSSGGISAAIAPAHANPVTGIQWLWGVSQSGTAGATMFIGSANERIRNPVNSATHISMESTDGYGFFSSKQGSHVGGNAWWDGASWQRYDTSAGSTVVIASTGGILFQSAVAGTGALAQTTKMTIDLAGSIGLRTAPLTGYGFRMAGLGETSATYGFQHVNSNVNRNIFYTRDDGYVYIQGPLQEDGAITVGGAATLNSTLSVAGNLSSGQINCPYIVCNGIDVGTGPIYFKNNGSYYINWDGGSFFQAVNMNVMSWGGFYFNGNGGIYIGGWDGTWIHTSHSIMCNGTTYGFSNNGGVTLVYDGSWHRFYGASGVGTSGSYYWMANNSGVGLYWDGTWVNVQPRCWSPNEVNADVVVVRNGSSGLRFVDDNVREVRPTSTNQLKTYVYDAWHQWHRTWDGTSMGYIDINGFHNGSTIKNKSNVETFVDGMSIVTDKRVRPVRYTVRDKRKKQHAPKHADANGVFDRPSVGFIAEEMVEVIPEVVGLDPETNEPAGINYGALVPILWDAVRTLNARVEELEEKLGV